MGHELTHGFDDKGNCRQSLTLALCKLVRKFYKKKNRMEFVSALCTLTQTYPMFMLDRVKKFKCYVYIGIPKAWQDLVFKSKSIKSTSHLFR